MIAAGAQPPLDLRVAPNVQEHRGWVARGSWALTELRAAVAIALVASLLTALLGAFVLNHLLFPPPNGSSPDPSSVLVGLVGAALQLLSFLIGVNAVADSPSKEEPANPQASSRSQADALPYLGIALLILLVGAAMGYSIGGDEGRQNMHNGVPEAPYAPTLGVLLASIVWGGTSVAFNVLVAFGMRAHLSPLIKQDASRLWMAFLASSIAGSTGSVALSLYGILLLGGTNPAPLMAILSMVALAILLHLVGLASRDLKAEPEPAPQWPAFVPVMGAPGAAPVMQGYDPQARPPARCPKCNSPKLSYFMGFPPQAQCHQCGQWTLY